MQQLELPFDQPTESPVASTLHQRGTTYGDFTTQATLSRTLNTIWQQHYYQLHGNLDLPPFILEGVAMVFHKLARAANGDAKFADNYTDVAGYAQLIVDGLATTEGATFSKVVCTTVGKHKAENSEEVKLSYS